MRLLFSHYREQAAIGKQCLEARGFDFRGFHPIGRAKAALHHFFQRNQQQIFFSSIAVILFIISLFHIMNSMNHTILARRKEYGIMRAMGITDSGFYKMILQTGILYGLLADALIFVCYHYIFRRVMDYYMAHVVQFLHVTSTVPNMVLAGIMVLNVVLAIVAVMIPARTGGFPIRCMRPAAVWPER